MSHVGGRGGRGGRWLIVISRNCRCSIVFTRGSTSSRCGTTSFFFRKRVVRPHENEERHLQWWNGGRESIQGFQKNSARRDRDCATFWTACKVNINLRLRFFECKNYSACKFGWRFAYIRKVNEVVKGTQETKAKWERKWEWKRVKGEDKGKGKKPREWGPTGPPAFSVPCHNRNRPKNNINAKKFLIKNDELLYYIFQNFEWK